MFDNDNVTHEVCNSRTLPYGETILFFSASIYLKINMTDWSINTDSTTYKL